MANTKSLSLQLIVSIFLTNSFACMAMEEEKPYILNPKTGRFYFTNPANNFDLDPTQVPKEFNHRGIHPDEDFDWNRYQNYIHKLKESDKKLFADAEKAKAQHEEKKVKTEQEYELERIKAGASIQQSQHAAPRIGSKSDKAQAKDFEAQARLHDKQANSLQYNNYYTVAKDGSMIIAQLVAPSLPQALSPVLLAVRQKIYKTAAEIDAEKTKNALEIANIKATEANEMASIAASLSNGSGRVQAGKGLEEVIEATRTLAKIHEFATKDLEKRQKETSELNEQLTKR